MSEEKLALLKNIFGHCRRQGREYLFKCPKCNHHKNKLSVNLEKNKFKCWICERFSGQLWRLIKLYGSSWQWEQWNNLDPFDISSESLTSRLFGDDTQTDQTTELPSEFNSLLNKPYDRMAQRARNYLLKERGLDEQDIIDWRIGYCDGGYFHERVIIPSFNLVGQINFFAARTFSPQPRNPYFYSNTSKNIVFNELNIDWSEPVVLVEGVFDAIKAGRNAIPLIGSSLREYSKVLESLVLNDAEVILALDPDIGTKKWDIAKLLNSFEIRVYEASISGYKDVGEMTKKEFNIRKNNAKKIDLTYDYLYGLLENIK